MQLDKCLRGQKKFITLETRNDGTKFTTSSLRSLSDDYRSLKSQYQSLQASLVSEVLQIAAGYTEPLLELNQLLAHLDVLVSFACVSATAPVSYVRPTITNRGELKERERERAVYTGCMVCLCVVLSAFKTKSQCVCVRVYKTSHLISERLYQELSNVCTEAPEPPMPIIVLDTVVQNMSIITTLTCSHYHKAKT